MTRHILIAEDDPNILGLLSVFLSGLGYEVSLARDGQEALEMAAQVKPDLLIADVMMPRMSGYDLCQRVRENPAWQGIKIIMLSAKGRDIEVTKGIAVGADAYVTKPFSTKDLIAKVQELLGE